MGALTHAEPTVERAGVAIPLALVLLVALGLLGTGVLVLAERQATTASAAVAWSRGRVVARGVTRSAATELTAEALPRGAPWASASLLEGTTDGVEYGVVLHALSAEWTLVRGWARGGPGVGRAEQATLAWTLDPATRVGAARAVLVHGGTLTRAADAVVEGSRITAAGEGASPSACAPWEEAMDSIFPTDRLSPSEREGEADSLGTLPRLGLLGPGAVRAAVTGRASGALTPRPLSDGGICRDEALNWGSPTDPEGPCGDRRIARYAPDDLTLDGGEGQGLLLVEGSLALENGAVFAGLVIVRDTLRLGPGARITGLVRSGGPAVLGSEALIRGRACPPLEALAAVPALRRPMPAPGGAWVRPF